MLVLSALLCVHPAHATPKALLVAASAYDSAATGWAPLNSDADLDLLRHGLSQRGVLAEHITVVSGPDVTRDAVLDALWAWDIEPGDHLYVHYSGHAQRISDQDGDERDGFDEAWALLDSPATLDHATDRKRYDGSLHLTDDDLAAVLQNMRKSVGPEGSVVVSMDTAHVAANAWSTPDRGGAPLTLLTRDARKVAREVRNKARPDGPGGGYDDALEGGDTLSPLVLLTASRGDQAAREHTFPGPLVAGAFTASLSSALAVGAGVESWGELYQRLAADMRRRGFAQVPQLEGAADAPLFDGTHPTPPAALRVFSVEGTELHLTGGWLRGVVPGTVLEVHAPGSERPDPGSLLGTATVTAASATGATATLSAPLEQDGSGAPVFVTASPTTDQVLRLNVALTDEVRDGRWERALAKNPLLEITDQAPQLTLVERRGRVWLMDGAPNAGDRPPPHPLFESRVADVVPRPLLRRLDALARSLALHRIDWDHPGNPLQIIVQPARFQSAAERVANEPLPGPRCTRDLDAPSGGELRLQEGRPIRVTVMLRGRPSHVSLLHTDGRGVTQQVFPPPGEPYGDPESGVVFDQCIPVRMVEDAREGVPAIESFKAFVHSDDVRIDFRDLLAADPDDADGALEQVLEWASASRGPATERAPGSSHEVTVLVERAPALASDGG